MKPQAIEKETLYSLLEGWPELKPDPRAMERLSGQMSQRMLTLRSEESEDPLEPHFRMLSWVWGIVAVGIYFAWPVISEYFTEYPLLLIVMTCLGGLACLAPLILLPVLRADSTARTSIQILRGGHFSC